MCSTVFLTRYNVTPQKFLDHNRWNYWLLQVISGDFAAEVGVKFSVKLISSNVVVSVDVTIKLRFKRMFSCCCRVPIFNLRFEGDHTVN